MNTEFFLIVLSRALVALSYLVATRVYLSILSLSEVGVLNYFLSVMQLCTMFGVYPAGSYYQSVFVKSVKDGVIMRESARYLIFLIGFGIFVSSILCLGKATGFISINWDYSFLFGLTMLFQIGLPMRETFLGCLNILLLRKIYIVTNLFASYITIVVGLIFVTRFPTSLSWLTATGLAHLVFGVGLIVYIVVKYNNPDARSPTGKTGRLKFVTALVFVSLGMWIVTDLGKIILDRFGGGNGKDALGLFSIVMTTGGAFVTTVEKIFTDLFGPRIFNTAVDDRDQLPHVSGMYLKRLFSVLIIAIVFTFFAAALLIYVVTGDKYKSLGLWIVLGAFFRSGIVVLSACQLIAQAFNRPGLFVRYFFLGGGLSAVCVGVGFWFGGVLCAATISAITIVLLSFKCVNILVSCGVVNFCKDDRVHYLKSDAIPLVCLIIVSVIFNFFHSPLFMSLIFSCILLGFGVRIINVFKKFSSWFVRI